MTQTDFLAFATFWQDLHNSMAAGKSFSETNMRFVFEAFEPYPLEFIKQATTQYSRREKFAPSPSDIISLMETGNKRPTADEAWGIVPKSERESAVWTDEMATAWLSASPLYYDGDKIGARMTFKAVYERECNESLVMNKSIRWWLSRGDDKAHLKTTVERAKIDGKLARHQAESILLGLDSPKTTVSALIAKSSVEESKKKNLAEMCRGLLAEIERVDKKEIKEKLEKEATEKQRRLDLIALAEQKRTAEKAANDDSDNNEVTA